MKLIDFHLLIAALIVRHGDDEVQIVTSMPSLGGRNTVGVDGIAIGFDWEKGKAIINPSVPLYTRTQEDEIKELRSQLSWAMYRNSSLERAVQDVYATPETEYLDSKLRRRICDLAHTRRDKLYEIPESFIDGDLRILQKFVGEIFDGTEDSPGTWDGGDLQDLADKVGLLTPVEVTESCGENCSCAGYGEFPMTCHKYSDTLKRAWAANEKDT